MRHINTVFSQLLSEIPRHLFNKVVERHHGDKREGSMKCWTQFCVILYGQLSSKRTLRDICLSWKSQGHLQYHFGASKAARSTLSDANRSRPSEIYLELFYWLLNQVRKTTITCKDAVRLIDSTTIDLCKQQFSWATFRRGKAGVKIHTVYDPNAKVPTFFSITTASKHDKRAAEKMPLLDGATYVFDRAYNDYSWYYSMTLRDIRFVGRMKTTAKFEVVEVLKASGKGVLNDELIRLSSAKAKKDYPRMLRRICFIREEDGKKLSFITNDLKRTAEDIAALYKQRWEIELFFKWIKQNLKIKRFVGTNENAVRTQIIIAMISYLLLKLVNQKCNSKLSLHQMLTLVAANLMSRRNIHDLLLQKEPEKPPEINTNQLCLGIC